MSEYIYSSKVDRWIPVLVVVTCIVCAAGPALEGEYMAGIILGLALLAVELVVFTGVKYKISGDKLGVRNFYRWQWYPIGKIQEIREIRSMQAAPALSTDRIALYFTDNSLLKSSMPLEISPKDKDGFIARLKSINPNLSSL